MISRKRRSEYVNDDFDENKKTISSSDKSNSLSAEPHHERQSVSPLLLPAETELKVVTSTGNACEVAVHRSDQDALIQQLHSNLRKEEERLRKLKMVQMYREKNNLEELGGLIDKWRDVCQQSLQDLSGLLPPPQPSLKELLDHLQIDYDLVHFDAENESFS